MTGFLDGVVIDIDHALTALDGSRWLWTFDCTEAGEPLMLRLDAAGAGTLSLPDVYRAHGPLTPERRPATAAMYRQVLEAA